MPLSDYIGGVSIVPDRITDSATGDGVDLQGGADTAYAIVSTELLDVTGTLAYTFSVQVSADNLAWDDSDADPVEVSVSDPTQTIISFTRSERYARVSLNVTDGPGDLRVGANIVVPPVASDSDVAPLSLTYDPEAQYVAESSAIIIPRGSGLPILFSPSTPTAIVAESNWEARLGVPGQTPITFSVADGNMTVDTETGDIEINPDIADTSALSIRNVVYLELWRKGSGDDNNSLLFRCPVTVVRTLIA